MIRPCYDNKNVQGHFDFGCTITQIIKGTKGKLNDSSGAKQNQNSSSSSESNHNSFIFGCDTESFDVLDMSNGQDNLNPLLCFNSEFHNNKSVSSIYFLRFHTTNYFGIVR